MADGGQSQRTFRSAEGGGKMEESAAKPYAIDIRGFPPGWETMGNLAPGGRAADPGTQFDSYRTNTL